MAIVTRRWRNRSEWLPVALAVVLSMCGGGSAPTPPTSPSPPTPTPPSPTPITAVLVAAGDIAVCGSDGARATATLLDGIPGIVLAVGDLAYMSGTAQEFADCYDPTWGRHKSRTRPIPGNHEYVTSAGAPYYAYFGDKAGPPGSGYYSYRAGGWLVLALNSNIPVRAGSAQYEWARAELRNEAGRCVAAYVHHPRFSSGPNGCCGHVGDLWSLLYEYGVEFVLSGHDHFYERFAPQDPSGRLDLARGVRQFVVGTGGHTLYSFEHVQPNSEVRVASWGVTKLTLASDSYSWEFVPVGSGPFGDTGTATCH